MVIKIAEYINGSRDAIIREWVAVADGLTPRNLSNEELLDAVREILDSIVHALQTASSERLPGSGPPVGVVKTPELVQVAKAHASHRFTQRFTLAQMAAEYRALRANVTRRWLAERRGEVADVAQELAQFNAAVDWSMASAVGWYDERLRKQQDDLKAADRNKDEFLAVLGHELRNPLAPLRSGLDILHRAPGNSELLDSVHPMMERQLSHLSRLVDDLLDFARIRRGEIQLEVARFDLNAAIKTAIEQLAASISDRRQDLVVKLSTSPLPVLGDFDRLTQVVANLLSNASKYTEEGGQITVTSDVENDRAAVRVVDTGYGIPPVHLETIFELFTQLPEHRQKTGGGGLGIGLALARHLVEMHHGIIEATSEGLGSGSGFHVALPLCLRSARGSETEQAVLDQAPARPRRVLVVDDNADAADTLVMLLRQSGHAACTAYDGEAALAQVAGFAPEVVFLDLGLPGMNGVEVAQKIRTMPGAEGIPIFAVTGWSQANDRRRTEEAGFDGHFVKPVSLPQIESALAFVRDAARD